jgi:glyoxylase-like metal-dependent hydrolase (beta-lactamase superfamily II)
MLNTSKQSPVARMPGRRPMAAAAAAVLGAAVSLAGTATLAGPARTIPAAAAAVRPPPAREFQPVRGDIWRVSNGNWWSLVYVTPEGILLVDPISVEFSTWLKGQLAERFPGKPVRYIVYSHSHFDHATGAGVFADSRPHIVAQERVLTNMDGRFPHMPGDMTDRNNDGKFETEEFDIPTTEHPGICGMSLGYFKSRDTRNKGSITPPEWFADVPKPDIVYSERMTLTFGGRRIDLVFPGLNHADDGTAVYFPAEKVLFSTDFPADALVTQSMRSLPSACGMFDQHPIAEWIRSYRTLESLDFDILAQGHGAHGFTRQDLAEGRRFFEDLGAAVSQGMAQGRTLAELKQTIKLEQYKDWAYYRLLPDNIEAAYYNLKLYR